MTILKRTWSHVVEGRGPKPVLAACVLGILWMLPSCSSTTGTAAETPDQMAAAFTRQFPFRETNTLLSIEPFRDDNEAGLPIDLLIRNVSGEKIIFEPGYGAQVLAYSPDRGEWIQIPDRAKYYGGKPVLGPGPRPGGTLLALVAVLPDLEGISLPATIRVLVAGEILNDGGTPTGETAIAYLDLTVHE
jgi:hypothetical protein